MLILSWEMDLAVYGEHDLLVYLNLDVLTKVYSGILKADFKPTWNFFFFIHLSVLKWKVFLKMLCILACYEENGSLVILDSIRGYFGSDSDILLLISTLKTSTESGLQIWVYLICLEEKDLLGYESSMPPKFHDRAKNPIMCKTFCIYHQSDLNMLSETEKSSSIEHHYKNLIITWQENQWPSHQLIHPEDVI